MHTHIELDGRALPKRLTAWLARRRLGVAAVGALAGVLSAWQPVNAQTYHFTGNHIHWATSDGTTPMFTDLHGTDAAHSSGYSLPAGLLSLHDTQTDAVIYAYCLQSDISVSAGTTFSSGGDPDPHITYIIVHYLRAPGGPAHHSLTQPQEAAAVQAAIWHFTNSFKLNSSNSANLIAETTDIINDAQVNGGSQPPQPHITLQAEGPTPQVPGPQTLTATVVPGAGGTTVHYSVTPSTAHLGASNGPATLDVATDPSGRAPVQVWSTTSAQFTVTAALDPQMVPGAVVLAPADGASQSLVAPHDHGAGVSASVSTGFSPTSSTPGSVLAGSTLQAPATGTSSTLGTGMMILGTGAGVVAVGLRTRRPRRRR